MVTQPSLMARRCPSLPLIIVIACVLAGAGCKQGVGDRCEQGSDCASGSCSVNGVAATPGGGVCLAVGSATGAGGSGSGGAGGSAGTTDGATDTGMDAQPDTGAPDVEDAAGDSGTADATLD